MTPSDRSARAILFLLAVAALAMPAAAWKSDLSEQVMSIAQAHDGADLGDVFAIEAEVVREEMDQIFLLKDDSGEMYVRLPSRILREQGAPERGERVRAAGPLIRETLDRKHQGMAVQRLERHVEHATRPPPAPSPPASPAAEEGEQLPASFGDPQVFRPSMSREWVERLGTARQELLEAREDLREADAAYGRELRRAGEPADMDPTIVERHNRAEQRVVAARLAIPPLVEEARREGVPDDILALYERTNAPR
jgi:uncharacterized protein YdeI (BOF family)